MPGQRLMACRAVVRARHSKKCPRAKRFAVGRGGLVKAARWAGRRAGGRDLSQTGADGALGLGGTGTGTGTGTANCELGLLLDLDVPVLRLSLVCNDGLQVLALPSLLVAVAISSLGHFFGLVDGNFGAIHSGRPRHTQARGRRRGGEGGAGQWQWQWQWCAIRSSRRAGCTSSAGGAVQGEEGGCRWRSLCRGSVCLLLRRRRGLRFLQLLGVRLSARLGPILALPP